MLMALVRAVRRVLASVFGLDSAPPEPGATGHDTNASQLSQQSPARSPTTMTPYLLKGEIPPPAVPPPRPAPTSAEELRHQIREARLRAAYELEFPYEDATSPRGPIE